LIKLFGQIKNEDPKANRLVSFCRESIILYFLMTFNNYLISGTIMLIIRLFEPYIENITGNGQKKSE